MEKKELIFELEAAKAYLDEDIQALGYILQDLDTTGIDGELVLVIPEVINHLNTLLKSMILNKNQIKETIEKFYKEEKE